MELFSRIGRGVDTILGAVMPSPSPMRQITAQQADSLTQSRLSYAELLRQRDALLVERNVMAQQGIEMAQMIIDEVIDPRLKTLSEHPDANASQIAEVTITKAKLQALLDYGRKVYR